MDDYQPMPPKRTHHLPVTIKLVRTGEPMPIDEPADGCLQCLRYAVDFAELRAEIERRGDVIQQQNEEIVTLRFSLETAEAQAAVAGAERDAWRAYGVHVSSCTYCLLGRTCEENERLWVAAQFSQKANNNKETE